MLKTVEGDASFPDSMQPVFRCLGDKGRKTTMALIASKPQGFGVGDLRRGLVVSLNRDNIPVSTVTNYLADLEATGLVERVVGKPGSRRGSYFKATEFGHEALKGALAFSEGLAGIKAEVEIDRILGRIPLGYLSQLITLAEERIAQRESTRIE